MPDVLGYRAKFGVLAPSTNTIVEPDFYAMAPPGVTLHTGRIFIENPTMGDDAAFEQIMVQIRASIARAVADVMSAQPDYLVMGMSSETFWGGRKGNEEFQQRVRALAGIPIATGANACERAVAELGSRRLGVVMAYQPGVGGQGREVFSGCGDEGRDRKCCACPA